MLNQCALYDNIEMSKLAKEWGATNFASMLQIGIKKGYHDIAQLAFEWLLEK